MERPQKLLREWTSAVWSAVATSRAAATVTVLLLGLRAVAAVEVAVLACKSPTSKNHLVAVVARVWHLVRGPSAHQSWEHPT